MHSQDTQFLPEVDANLTVNSYFRTYLQAKDDREGGDPTQFTFGPSVQFYLKPLLKLKQITLFDLDDAKRRPLVIESGYRLITQPNTANENRAIEAVTFHLLLFAGILLADRNRADLDWKNGVFTWRYRNRLTLERTFTIHSYHLIPYVAAAARRKHCHLDHCLSIDLGRAPGWYPPSQDFAASFRNGTMWSLSTWRHPKRHARGRELVSVPCRPGKLAERIET